MAYVPDIAIESMDEVSGSAFRLYTYLCMRRNRRSGVCFPSLRLIADETGINYSHASVCKLELIDKGWIETVKGGRIRPLKGFEEGENVLEIPKKVLENPKHILENPKSDGNEVLENPKNVLEIPNNVLENPKSHNKDILTREVTNEVTIRERVSLTTATSRSRGSRIPEPFILTAQMRDWARENHPDVDAISETQSFVDYFRGVSGKNGIKLDWEATWRNWIRRANQYNGTKFKGRKSNNETVEDYNRWFESLG